MPSKLGFGNYRKKGSAYKYGIDSKNPIQMKSPVKKKPVKSTTLSDAIQQMGFQKSYSDDEKTKIKLEEMNKK